MRGATNLLLGLGQQVERAHEVFPRELLADLEEPRAFPFEQVRLPGGIDREQHHVAHDDRELPAHEPEVLPRLHGPVGERQRAGAIVLHHGAHQIEQEVAPHQAKDGGHVVGGNRGAGKRHHLVERTLGIAHAPRPSAR